MVLQIENIQSNMTAILSYLFTK